MHLGCATYLAARDLAPVGRPTVAGDGGLWPETRGAVLALEPVQRRPTIARLSGRGGGDQALLIGLMVAAFVVLAISRVAPAAVSGDPPASLGAGASLGPVVSAAASLAPATAAPTLAPSTAPSAPPGSPEPSGATPPSASPGPGASAGAADPSPITYRVKSGDTLRSIALEHGTTVKALRAANDLGATNLIRPGQVLIIPG